MSKKLNDYTKEELIEIIKDLKSRKKFGLVWEDSPEDVVRLCQTELPVLEELPERAIQKAEGAHNNFIVEGDNYHSLSVLNYTHAGKVDVIYIDPPYNTGARDWKYNNNYVDESDTFRHSKWLSFMSQRLILAKELLSDQGIICVTIDDYEMPRLWLLLEQIFGYENHLGTAAIRINPGGRKSKRKLAAQHEYALFFAKNGAAKVAQFYIHPESKSHSYKQAEDGTWYEERNLRKEGQDSLATKKDGTLSQRYYPIYYNPDTGEISTVNKYKVEILPIDTKGQKRIWRRDASVIDDMYADKDVFIKETKKNGPQVYFRFKGGVKGETPKSFWEDKKYSASEHGTGTLDKVMGKIGSFQFPKSPYAVIDCIKVCSNSKTAIVLDFFAGSGTTGQAVLELNKEDGGNRRFILCTNNENKIAEEVTYPRINNVIEGYDKVVGIPANVRYFKTNFVSKEQTNDQTRAELVARSTDMICFREDTFETVLDASLFKVFCNSDHYTAIIFDPEAIGLLKNALEKLQDDRSVHIYIFSLSNDTYESDFADLVRSHELRPIPESILEVYRRIFNSQNKNMGEYD